MYSWCTNMNPYLQEFELKERRREMLAEANRRHLVRLYNNRYQGKIDELFLALADRLIRLGETLRRRHSHPTILADDLCRE